MIETRQVHTVSDFVRNHKAHLARLKETRTPEVLTVNGRPEAVLVDADSYENLMNRFHNMETIARTRARFDQLQVDSTIEVSREEQQRRNEVLDELIAETERLGLYK